MYQPAFYDDIIEEDLSPLENFTTLIDLIKAGGIKAERARRIMNQFSSTTSLKRDNSTDGTSAAPTSRKSKYYGARRFKN